MKLRQLVSFELNILLRNRWLLLTAVLFATLMAVIAAVQAFVIGESTGFSRQTASMLNLVLFVIPLFTLALGSMGTAGDRESGWLTLLKTYPMKPMKWMLGKFIALFVAMLSVLLIGFGTALIISSGLNNTKLLLILLLLSIVTTAIFTALAVTTGFFAKTRIQALTISLAIWAVLLLMLDYAIIAIGTLLSEQMLMQFIIFSIFINPIELIRTSFLILTGNGAVLGPKFFAFIQFSESTLGMLTYGAVACLWIALPLLFAIVKLRKEGSVWMR